MKPKNIPKDAFPNIIRNCLRPVAKHEDVPIKILQYFIELFAEKCGISICLQPYPEQPYPELADFSIKSAAFLCKENEMVEAVLETAKVKDCVLDYPLRAQNELAITLNDMLLKAISSKNWGGVKKLALLIYRIPEVQFDAESFFKRLIIIRAPKALFFFLLKNNITPSVDFMLNVLLLLSLNE